ncbi:putative PAS/PAC sensor protein [Denitrovibrio acetiphilus DSM 12809]|uniref:Putative PAS/PAC sensor protein n=1 Tax=Denitrovibrio acetiphilus (strain DSM 12809 / NBRC 114555 / N2460) TaxID=522772 RepID=D4H2F6_DENA2|nr:ATP-binding cassette domain-containing protein [Denitrovibrio acetiphilus]ADD68947.1 putative PAS/PAC sensor protein [Denitrovibrio acetiphilus DSM 12809]
MNNILTFESVSKTYGENNVLKNLSFSVRQGEVIGILGPSGVGKSTMLNITAGLEKNDSGNVVNHGQRIAYVFQKPRLLPWKNITDNVMLPLLAMGFSSEKAKQTAMAELNKMGLGSSTDLFPSQLSGGMAQRVSLARAFALQPDLLLLDEPFNALDIKMKEMLMFMMQENLRHSPATVLYVTHAPDEILHIADRIFIFGEGGTFESMDCQEKCLSKYYAQGAIKGFLGQKTKQKGENIMYEWMNNKDNFETMDMRRKTPEFMPELLRMAEDVQEGKGLHIIQSFEPIPLYYHMEKLGFIKYMEKPEDNEYHVYFYRPPSDSMAKSAKMSGFLNINEKRAETIASIVMDFFNGKKLEELKPAYDAITPVTAAEFAYAEQMISDKGIPDSNFENNIDELITLFRSSLDKSTAGEFPEGHPINTFMAENRAIEKLIISIRDEVSTTKDYNKLTEMFKNLKEINHHYVRKETQLFPYLERKGFDKPSTVMWSLHDKIRQGIKTCIKMLEDNQFDSFNEICGSVLDETEGMIYKEEKVLFPTAKLMLTENEWKLIRKGERELSYCFIDTPPTWGSHTATEHIHPATPSGNGLFLKMNEGMLSYEQLDAIMCHMPVDVSFVDADDKVRYYNQSSERIFPRSPDVIGREVRYCHPPKSVDTVVSILEAFKKGEQDVAEFWLTLDEKFIYIRYFAVRDTSGTYMGTLEVMQNVTHIRELEGSRTLISWD